MNNYSEIFRYNGQRTIVGVRVISIKKIIHGWRKTFKLSRVKETKWLHPRIAILRLSGIVGKLSDYPKEYILREAKSTVSCFRDKRVVY
jgi:hypothetical protein